MNLVSLKCHLGIHRRFESYYDLKYYYMTGLRTKLLKFFLGSRLKQLMDDSYNAGWDLGYTQAKQRYERKQRR